VERASDLEIDFGYWPKKGQQNRLSLFPELLASTSGAALWGASTHVGSCENHPLSRRLYVTLGGPRGSCKLL
jgi:hypothetical protein